MKAFNEIIFTLKTIQFVSFLHLDDRKLRNKSNYTRRILYEPFSLKESEHFMEVY